MVALQPLVDGLGVSIVPTWPLRRCAAATAVIRFVRTDVACLVTMR
jgi:hypothetical protein